MFNQQKNKKFSYKSRFSKDSSTPTSLEDKKTKEFVPNFKREGKGNSLIKSKRNSMIFLILILVLLLIAMYVLEIKFR